MSLKAKDISIIRMLTNPPQEIVKANYKIVSLKDGYVYQFNTKRCFWEQKHHAVANDYLKLPQL